MAQSRPVMIYSGGKFLLREWVIDNLPAHEIYVEPFGGAASVLMSKLPAKREVYNDLNSEVVNVFRVLRNPRQAKRLEEVLRLTPFSREEMQLAKKPTSKSAVERARQTIICAFMSRSRQARDGAGMRYSKMSNRAPEKDWDSYPDQIEKFTRRLKGVMIENKPALEVFDFWDGPSTLFYCDPPYLHETRNDKHLYAHEMSEADHIAFLDKIVTLQGMVVLSGYDSPMYSERLAGWRSERLAGWRSERLDTLTSTHREVSECLWLNPAASKNVRQMAFELDGPGA